LAQYLNDWKVILNRTLYTEVTRDSLKISRPGIGKLVYISRPFNHNNREPQEFQDRERDYHPFFCRYTSQSFVYLEKKEDTHPVALSTSVLPVPVVT